MYKLVLPLVIDRRRAILLDLIHQDEERQSLPPFQDYYVVEFPSQPKELLCIQKGHQLHSLMDDLGDKDLSSLKCSLVTVSDARSRFRLEFTESLQVAGKAPETVQDIAAGLKLQLHMESEKIVLQMRRVPGGNENDVLTFILEVCYTTEAGVRFYSDLTISVVHESKLLLAGLDFGSEASQIKYAVASKRQEVQHFDLFSAIKAQTANGTTEDSGTVAPPTKDKLSPAEKKSVREENIKIANKEPDREEYIQNEPGNTHLYRSIFFARKVYGSSSDDLSLITKSSDATNETGEHLKNYHKVPNLKLIGQDESLGLETIFETSDGPRNLRQMRDDIFNRLVERMVSAFLQQINFRKEYSCLRFTVLVPNIYEVERVSQTRDLASRVIRNINRERLGDAIKAFEIDVLSESDASFLGYEAASSGNIESGSYIIVIDCGKGTTDYSLVLIDQQASMRSLYRSGFAGAGNIISYAFFETLVRFLKDYAAKLNPTDENEKKKITDFFKESIHSPSSDFRYKLYKHAERLKKGFGSSESMSPEEVSSHWLSARTGDIDLAKVFVKGDVEENLDALLDKIHHIHDFYGFIDKACEYITDTTCRKLRDALPSIKGSAGCGGILLTGRAFLFSRLVTQMDLALRGLRGVSPYKILDPGNVSLKEICMLGIFNNRFVTHSDVISTPMEVSEKNLDRNIRNSDLEVGSFIQRFLHWIDDFVIGQQFYDESSNLMKVTQTKLFHAWFRMGETLFKSGNTTIVGDDRTRLSISRSGMHIVAYDDNDTRHIIDLERAPGRIHATPTTIIWKSMFPTFYRPEIIGIWPENKPVK